MGPRRGGDVEGTGLVDAQFRQAVPESRIRAVSKHQLANDRDSIGHAPGTQGSLGFVQPAFPGPG